MKILYENPPMLQRILDAGLNPDMSRVIFNYGGTLYVPGGWPVPDYLIAHEEMHTPQQGDDPDGWWDRYLSDPYFRLDQEIEAYAAQYDFMCIKIKDRNQRSRILYEIAGIVASPTYGSMVTRSGAMRLIKIKSKTR